jgi:catechol 2,3-dioxygenase-like lactoylglutathione lyase family enzyme
MTPNNVEPQVFGQHNGYDIYPMPMFARLEAANLADTVAWYREALGFGVMFEMPMLIHLRRAKYQDLLVMPGRGQATTDTGLTLSFAADGEIDALFAQASKAPIRGRSSVEAPALMPWNAREMRLTDPDGRRLVFHERANDPEASARMRAMFEKQGS